MTKLQAYMRAFMVCAWLVLSFTSSFSAGKPNVLMIAIDDLRPLFGQAYGVPEVKTPNMDKFVLTGTVMQNSYVQTAVCGPSRSSILTGRRPDSTYAMNGASWCWSVRGQFTTIPHYFRNNGYVTVGSGKIFHPNACGASNPHTLGDDRTAWSMPYFVEPECIQYGSVPCPSTAYWHYGKGDSVFESDLDDDQITDGQLARHAQARLANFTQQGIGSGSQPFFMAVGLHKPHLPHIAPKKYFDMYDVSQISLPPNPYVPKNFPKGAWYSSGEIRSYADAGKQFSADNFSEAHPLSDMDIHIHRRAYYAATSYVDAQVGVVMDALESSGFANNTIVVIWSDHGWHLGDTNSWGKCTNFETGTRNVLMWRVPGGKSSGKSERLVEMVDLYPTLLDLAGLPSMRACNGDEPPTVECLQGETYASEFTPGDDRRSASVKEAKKYAFSQWLYGAVEPGVNGPVMRRLPEEDSEPVFAETAKVQYPSLIAGRTVGYSVRSGNGYRLTEYLPYDIMNFTADWSKVPSARELYDYNLDPHETVNQASNSSYAAMVNELHAVLKAQFDRTMKP